MTKDCGCVPNMQDGGWLTRCVAHTPPKRCDYVIPGLGRCRDTSGFAHGHHFKPGQLDPELVLSREEAAAVIAYMEPQYLDANRWPQLSQLLTRLHLYLRVAA
jgi:hypothetical protein